MNDDDSTSEEGVDAFTRVSMRRAVRSGVGRVVGSSQGAYYRDRRWKFWFWFSANHKLQPRDDLLPARWWSFGQLIWKNKNFRLVNRLPPHFGPFYPQVDRFFAIKFLWTNGGQRSTWDELYFSRTFQEFGQTDCA